MEIIYIAVIEDGDAAYQALSFKADGELIDLMKQCSEKEFLLWISSYKNGYNVEIFYYEDVVKFAQELYVDLEDYSLPVLCKILSVETKNKDELYILVSVILKLLNVKTSEADKF